MLGNSLKWVVHAQYNRFEWLLTLTKALTMMYGWTLKWYSQKFDEKFRVRGFRHPTKIFLILANQIGIILYICWMRVAMQQFK